MPTRMSFPTIAHQCPFQSCTMDPIMQLQVLFLKIYLGEEGPFIPMAHQAVFVNIFVQGDLATWWEPIINDETTHGFP